MADDNKFKITLTLGSLQFSPRIERSEELYYREAAEYINAKIDAWRRRTSGFTEAQTLSMVALELALELSKSQKSRSEIVSELRRLDDLLKTTK